MCCLYKFLIVLRLKIASLKQKYKLAVIHGATIFVYVCESVKYENDGIKRA